MSSQRKQRRIVRGILKAVAGLFGLALIVVAAALAFSQTATFRTWLREQVIARANEALRGRVAMGSIDGNLLGALTLTDLHVTTQEGELLAVRQLSANYNLIELARSRRLVLNDVAIDGVRAHLAQDERGWNVLRLLPPAAEVKGEEAKAGSSLAVRLENLTIRDGWLDVKRPAESYGLRDINLRASAEINPDGKTIDIEALAFAMPERQLLVKKVSGKAELRADGTVDARDLVVLTGASSLRGRARIEKNYDVQIDVERLSADELHRIATGELPIVDLSGTIRARGPATAVSLDGTKLKSDGAGGLSIGGTVDTASEGYGYDVRVALDHLDAAALLGPSRPKTDLTGTVAVKGTGATVEQAAGTIAVALDDSAIRATKFEQLSAKASIENRRVILDATAKTAAGNASIAGTVNQANETYDLRAKADQFDPTVFMNQPDLSARINGTVAVHGTGFEPKTARADAQLSLEPSRIKSVEIRKLDGKLQLADGQLKIERFNLDSNAATAQASGSLGVGEMLARKSADTASGRLQYDVRIRDLEPLASLAGTTAAGSLNMEGTASGRLDALDVQSNLSGHRLAMSGSAVDALSGKLTARGLGGNGATADFSVHADEIRSSARRLASADVHGGWKQSNPERSEVTLSVRAHEDGKHQHTLRANASIQPEERRVSIAELTLQLGNDTWKNTGTPQIVMRGPRVTVSDFELRSASGVVQLAGQGGTTGTENVNLTVRNLEISPFVSNLQGDVKGRLSAEVHITGTAHDPQLKAELSVDQLEVEKVRYDTAHVNLSAARGTATAGARIAQSANAQLAFDAQLPLRASLSPFVVQLGSTFTGTVRATRMDLAFLDPLLPQVNELHGILDADLALSGPLREPVIRGPLSISGGHAYVVPTGVRYDPIELRVHLDSPAFAIESLKISSGSGSLTGSGQAKLEKTALAGEAKFELHDFPLLGNKDGEGKASGWLWIGGSTKAPIIEGALDTERLVFRIPEQMPGAARPPDPTITIVGVDAPEATARAADAPPQTKQSAESEKQPALYDRAAIHVQVNVPHNAWLRRSDTNIELRGWITTWKKPNAPIHVAGDIDVVRGWYQFQGKKFTVSEGEVTLTGQDFNPLLNVVAVHESGDYTVRVKIGGKLTEPTLKLESDPSLEQAEILSVLVFGKPARELNQGESKGLQQRALGIASGYAASEFRQSVADALGVDNLEIEPSTEGIGQTSLSIGKYLTEDVFVSISHKFAEQSVEQLRVQYFLTPRWTVETASDTLGDSGIDVFWRRRY